ncbi:hypothetical protein BK809_0005543 [Diplodia seriata]|uniref:Uncharacterized protein n=1 Tax=Diplodia seriata TaxID=420778 RepID=A0A1S8BMQ3_9PEZI|nr:hypothetical protein BK809_0005543 [Diplodia seriata]
MSNGFYERLSAISSDPASPDGMTELVVAALGSFGRYYICWKTRAGEYKQESSGLPTPLHQWLFPAENGTTTGKHKSTRDLATLQVVLGHGDDFFAADRDGKIERKASTASSTPESRTASPPQPNDPHHRSSLPIPPSLDRTTSTTRRRARTLSMVGPPGAVPTFRLSTSSTSNGGGGAGSIQQPAAAAATASAVSPISELPGIKMSSSSISTATATTARPLAVARRTTDWRQRPRSIAFGEGELLRVPETGTGTGTMRAREQTAAAAGLSRSNSTTRVRGTSASSLLTPSMAVVGTRGERVGGRGVEGQGPAAVCCKCGCHAASTAAAAAEKPAAAGGGVQQAVRPVYATAGTQAEMVKNSPPPPQSRPAYVDAGVQTDAPPPPPPPSRLRRSSSSSSSSARKRRSVASSSSSISYSDSGTSPAPYSSSSSSSYHSSSSSSSSYDSESQSDTSSNSRRSSAALTDITTPSTTYEGGGGGSLPPTSGGNPVQMGKMQDYFRSSRYQLGDALRPPAAVSYYQMGGGYGGGGWRGSYGVAEDGLMGGEVWE